MVICSGITKTRFVQVQSDRLVRAGRLLVQRLADLDVGDGVRCPVQDQERNGDLQRNSRKTFVWIDLDRFVRTGRLLVQRLADLDLGDGVRRSVQDQERNGDLQRNTMTRLAFVQDLADLDVGDGVRGSVVNKGRTGDLQRNTRAKIALYTTCLTSMLVIVSTWQLLRTYCSSYCNSTRNRTCRRIKMVPRGTYRKKELPRGNPKTHATWRILLTSCSRFWRWSVTRSSSCPVLSRGFFT